MHTHSSYTEAGWTCNPLTVLELLASRYRNTDHDIESELREIVRQLVQIKNSDAEQEETLKALAEGKARLLGLKRQLAENSQEQSDLYDVLKKRIHHQEELSNHPNNNHWQLETEIMQELLCHGQTQRARQLQHAHGQEALYAVETDLLAEAHHITAQINEGNLLGVRVWADENLHMLDKLNSPLEFELTACEYLSLLRCGQTDSACHALRKGIHKRTLSHQQQLTVRKLSFLLADPQAAPPLAEHLQRLLHAFRKSFSEIYSLPMQSHLCRRLSVGLSALKSVCCSDGPRSNALLCPICTPSARTLADRIPMLTRESSSLICRLNGSIMDEQNHPLALPSNHIYSLSGLTEHAKQGQYLCPLTDTTYPQEQAKRVYFA